VGLRDDRLMLFSQSFWAGMRDGDVTVTIRRWKRRQAIAGHRYRTGAGIIEVHEVDVIGEADITDADARASGFPSAAVLVAELRGTPDLPLYRVRFTMATGPDPRAELAATADLSAEDRAEIDRRLARLDKASKIGPWTHDVLALIAARPEVRAGDLADVLGRERLDFKLDVRKLKALGLTISFPVGYRLSPRGQAYLAG
jgi:hypothetical protein